MKFVNHTSKVYDMLTVISYAGMVFTKTDKRHTWNCKCKCGQLCQIRSDMLKKSSCGCRQKQAVMLNNSKRKKPNAESATNTLFLNYKKGATDRKLTFSLSKVDFLKLTLQNCHYCDRPPKQIQKAMGGNYIYNGVDRKLNTEGYSYENCVPCCKICNRAKLNMSYNDFMFYLNSIKQLGIIKPFYLERVKDVTGTSGVGIVAVGAILPSGRCILEWLSKETTETIFENIAQIERLHGHNGNTNVILGVPVNFNEKPVKRLRKKKKDD